jgi:chromosomal replication initiation ATPase DnaA
MDTPQLVLEFPKSASYEPLSFIVTSSNQQAHEWIKGFKSWPSYGLMLIGPSGCGKSHLAHIYQDMTGARFISRHELVGGLPVLLAQSQAFILEDIHHCLDQPEALFHLLNLVREEQKAILFTSTRLFDERDIPLKDLLSRLRALPSAYIQSPDDILFKAVMTKRFADLQLKVEDRIIQYLLIRSERSFTALHHLIDQIYAISLALKHKPTLAIVRKLLETE